MSRPAGRHIDAVVFAVCIALVVSCADEASLDARGSGDEGTGTTKDEPPGPDGDLAEGCGTTGWTGLHRLTRNEFDNSVRDLTGIDGSMSRLFPEDHRANVFDNNAVVNGLTPEHVSAYFEVTAALAAEILAERPARVFLCEPAGAIDEVPCARRMLTSLLHRAYRRPVTDEELAAVMTVYEAGREQSHDEGMRAALQAVLLAPQFHFRRIAAPEGAAARPLGRHELASRLSYFLWSSLPDDELSLAAERGELTDADGLAKQVRRMLADPRGANLVDNFAPQWLALRTLYTAEPDARLFPEWNEQLRTDMIAESSRLFQHVFSDQAPVLDLLTADYSFVNGNLARHYGMAAPGDDAFGRVDRSQTQRRGVFTHGAVLTMTSNADHTSVVRRGKWVLDNLLCQPLPPPPDDVAVISPDAAQAGSKFEQLEQHRSNPSCAGCHGLIDPLGFALEAYDPIGRERSTDEHGHPVHTAGVLPDGDAFDGARELAESLAGKGTFELCVVTSLYTFALGRELNAGDRCIAERLAQSVNFRETTFSQLLGHIVGSAPFRLQAQAAPEGKN